jgi:hypothetical protein
MQPLPLALPREPRVWIEGDAALMSALRQSRDKELFELRLTDAAGRLTAPLAVVAKAVRSAEVGGASDPAPVGRIAAACLATLTPPARSEPRVLAPDLQGMIARHHDGQVRRDELTRLSVRDEHEAMKRATAAASATVIAPAPDRGACVKRDALIARNIRRWPRVESHLKYASSNGLSDAAKAEAYGCWWEGDALKWAEARNYLKRTEAEHGELHRKVHRMAG